MEMKGTMSMCGRVRFDGSRKIGTASSCLLCVMTLFFLLSADFGSLSVPLFHKPVTVFLPCSGRLCLMEMGMNDRVR